MAVPQFEEILRVELRSNSWQVLLHRCLLLAAAHDGPLANDNSRTAGEQFARYLPSLSEVELRLALAELTRPHLPRYLPEERLAGFSRYYSSPPSLRPPRNLWLRLDQTQSSGPCLQWLAWEHHVVSTRDWAGYRSGLAAYKSWHSKATAGQPWFGYLAAALHPGYAFAMTRYQPDPGIPLALLREQASVLALPMKVARELWRRSHSGEPTPVDLPAWPADPFLPTRKLTLYQGEFWSVGADGVCDGHEGTMAPPLEYRGDYKL